MDNGTCDDSIGILNIFYSLLILKNRQLNG